MSPPAKKQTPSLERTVLTFTTPGLKPDVRLKIFDDLEIHCHSVLLKLHSAFFRKFLDSPDKPPGPASPVFHYEWVMTIDEDGSWHLMSVAAPVDQVEDLSKLEGHKWLEQDAFEKLLCAIYNEPYKVTSIAELSTLTKIADYYCALRILSRTLDSALHSSHDLIEEIWRNPCKAISIATKLRNSTLFRESLVWVLGPWRKPRYNELKTTDPICYKAARRIHGEMSLIIVEVFQECLDEIGAEHSVEPLNDLAMATYTKAKCTGVPLPLYLKGLQKILYIRCLGALLDNNLPLDKSGLKSGEEYLEDYFLSASISDEDLPWDVNETDW